MPLGTVIISGQILPITRIEIYDNRIHFVAVAQSDVVVGASEEVRIYGRDATLITMLSNWPTAPIQQTWDAGTVFNFPVALSAVSPYLIAQSDN